MELINIAKELIRFRTVSDNKEDMGKCISYIEEYFRKENIPAERFCSGGKISLLATLKKTRKPGCLLVCHMDVVPAKEEMFLPGIKEGRLYGRGALDDKGPLAVSMMLMKELSSMQDKPDVGLLVTSDEEQGGHDGTGYVLRQGVKPGLAIVLDGGSPNEYITRAKGIVFLKMSAKGKEAHGCRPWEGKNALEMIYEAFSRIKSLFPEKDGWYTTVNLANVSGGDAKNKVPGEAEAGLDIRYTEEHDADEVIQKIQQEMPEGVSVEAELKEPFFFADEHHPKIESLLSASRRFYEDEPKIEKEHGGSDARFFTAKNIPCIVTGPSGCNEHTEGEFLELDSLERFYGLLKEFLGGS